MPEIQKEKMTVAAPYADRKSRQFEIREADPLCPNCMMRMTWRESLTSDEAQLWCINCASRPK